MLKNLIKFKLIVFIANILLILLVEYIFCSYLKYDNANSFYIYDKKYNSNFLNITDKLNISDKIAVLTYHMVLSNYEKNLKKNYENTLSVSKSTFNKQMKWF